MDLLLDVGNTRVKWAWLEEFGLAASSAAAHDTTHRAWQAEIEADGRVPHRLVVSNVAGATVRDVVVDWSLGHFNLQPEMLVSSAEACGVRNAYAHPAALGVDRWLALLAARSRMAGPVLVVSAGTAFAIDPLDGAGRHRGGCVMPGERLMREALYAQTSGVAAAALLDAAAVEDVFGVNTAGAVQQGARLALASLVDRTASAFEAALGVAPAILMSGGGAADVAPLVARRVEIAPHLVLEGLALVAGEGPP
jgi:type III pantothenate kinase